MSSLFNQTNIAPGTPFSGGGGSNFPNGLAVGGISLQAGGTSFLVQPANEIFLGDGAGGTALYGISSIAMVNAVMGSASFLNITDFSNANPNFRLTNLSTLTAVNSAGGNDINITALASTLKVAFPGCVG
jgi:hypothetical protein